MKIPLIQNVTTSIKKFIYLGNTNCKSVESILLPDLDSKKISLTGVQNDIFQKQTYSDILAGIQNDVSKSYIADCFLRANPINEDSYTKLSLEGLEAVRAQLKLDIVNDAKSLVEVSKIIKRIFDLNFGENQYIFVSIGRSLSALAKSLEYMGVETKQIPLSGCSGKTRNTTYTVNTMINQSGFEKYKKFLEKTLPDNTNKIYIFSDYVSTGKTLEVFETLLHHPQTNLNLKKEKYIGINELLEKFVDNNQKNYINTIIDFNKKLYRQEFDKYAEIDSLNYKELNRLDFALKPGCLRANKLIQFCILDMLKTMNLSKSGMINR